MAAEEGRGRATGGLCAGPSREAIQLPEVYPAGGCYKRRAYPSGRERCQSQALAMM